MTEATKPLPRWIIFVTSLFAVLEIAVSLQLSFAPETVLETVDLNAVGVRYLIYLWASRQFALGIIFGFAAIKKSIPMLTICYIFFLVMFIGDLIIGILQKENGLIISAIALCLISAAMILALNKLKE